MTIQIGKLTFKTQKELHAYINDIRICDCDEEFHRLVNTPENFFLLCQILNGRPSKKKELAGRRVESWTRVRRGPHWSFDVILGDGERLDVGMSKGDISEFVHNQRG